MKTRYERIAELPIWSDHGDLRALSPERILTLVESLQGSLSLAEEGLANYALEVEQLKVALAKYGYHTSKCSAGFPISDHCTCGFSDALRKSGPHPEPGPRHE